MKEIMSNVSHEVEGWYFYFRDNSCKIGPYKDLDECNADAKKYMETGRITDEKENKQ